MEEQVGALWHRLVTRLADRQYHDQAVLLSEVKGKLSIFFRALGGDGGLQIQASEQEQSNFKRNIMQRIAGHGQWSDRAWRDREALKLPARIACFNDHDLNQQLYYWLAGLAANEAEIVNPHFNSWIARSQLNVLLTLDAYPGLIRRYSDLVKTHLTQRPDANKLTGKEKELELQIRQALVDPGSVRELIPCRYEPYPVPLWLRPGSDSTISDTPSDGDNNNSGEQQTRELEDIATRKAERVQSPEENRGLITVRMENIFTWGEFVNLDRGNEDQDDVDQAEAVARDLDNLAVARNQRASGVRLKFDLDLPAAEQDDTVIQDGILLPEWDWRQQRLREHYCHVVEYLAKDACAAALPSHLRKTANRLKNQFQMLAPARSWQRLQDDGEEIDLDSYLRFETDRRSGNRVNADGLYRQLNKGSRDLACLLVADLSLSTDTWVNNQQRVIDVIRDSLFLFAESLQATGDPFSLIGFSSRKRDPVRIHILKSFEEPYNAAVRGRISVIKPGYYTRLGAAIRYATAKLSDVGQSRRLMLILSDGKPNDLDQYEGRYGIEDTRQAIHEAKQCGLQPFCVTIDQKGSQYLPYLFGTNDYAIIHNPLHMPRLLPRLYARITE